jgi:MATE family multidrug resistance protein
MEARGWLETSGRLLSLAWPIILSRLGVTALTLVDGIMVGRAGVDELAYLAVASQPQQTLAAVGLAGMAGLPAAVVGAGIKEDGPGAGRWLASALAITGLIGAVLIVPLLYGEALFSAARQPPDIIAGGKPVLSWLAWSMPAVLMQQAGSLYFEALGRPRIPLYVVTGGVLLKIALNLALVPSLGAQGAAIGTVAVRWAMLAALLAAAFRPPFAGWDLVRVDLRGSAGWLRLVQLMRVGLPVASATLFESTGFLTLAGFAGTLGAESLAGYQIARNLYQPPHIPPLALGLATSIFLAGAVHRGNPSEGRATVGVGFALNNAFAIGVGGLLALFPLTMGGLFTNDGAFLAQLKLTVMITAALIVFDSIQGFVNQTLRGLSDGLVPSVIQLAAFWGVAVPLAYHLGFTRAWGLDGVLAGLCIGLAVSSAFLAFRLYRHPKLRRR